MIDLSRQMSTKIGEMVEYGSLVKHLRNLDIFDCLINSILERLFKSGLEKHAIPSNFTKSSGTITPYFFSCSHKARV